MSDNPADNILMTFTQEDYATMLQFFQRGLDDLEYYAGEYPNEYSEEDNIQQVIRDATDLLNRLHHI